MNDLTKRGGQFVSGLMASCVPAIGAIAFFGASPASALVIETASVQNTYGYAVGTGNTYDIKKGGDKGTFFVPAHLPSEDSEVGLNYEGTASPGNLFFLHNNYCVGTCQTFSQTIITFTLFNNGEAPVDLRFDSQITPGHIARILGNQGASLNGSFDFRVTEGLGREPNTLYSASGGVNSDGIYLFTNDLQFNGLTQTDDPNGRYRVLDWGTTNLSLALSTLGAGETTQVQYIATYGVSSDAICADVTECGGLQIVFGDPRNDGGVSNLLDAPLLAQGDDPVYPVIGRNYGASMLSADFVPFDANPQQDPAPFTPPTYGPLFVPSAGVPEPSNWALMVGGIGLIGGFARRRRRAVQHVVA